MLGNLFEDDGDVGFSVAESSRNKYPGIDLPPPPRSACGLCGISNQGATCYLNSLIQTLVYTPEFRESLFYLGKDELGSLKDKDKPKAKVRVIPIQLQRLFARLLLSNQQSVSTEDLTLSFGWTNNEQFQQQDVQELNRILFCAIESSLVGTAGSELVRQLYHGNLVNQVKCLECGFISEREEDYMDLPVTVAGSAGLEESLRSQYCDTENMDGQNQYRCSKCDKLVDAAKGARLRRIPSILTFSFLRFSFDYQKMERYKESGRFVFPHHLDMRPYCENSAEGEGMEYELFSVVIHGGGAHGGHYHAYIRDLDGLGKWVPPEEEEIVIAPDPSSGDVDVIECESPLDLILCVLGKQKNKGITINNLCQEIMKQTGVSWNNRFKKRYGSIVKFICTREDKFIYDEQHTYVSLKVNKKGTAEPNDVQQSANITDSESNPHGNNPHGNNPHGNNPHDNNPQGNKKSEKLSNGECWFDFNDSRVHPIHTKDIEKQFQGKESAYMVFYRRKSMKLPEKAKNNPSFRITDDIIAEVTEENQELEGKRKEYRVLINTIKIQVHYVDEYQYSDGGLRPREQHVPCHEMKIDQRSNAAQMFDAIRELGNERLLRQDFCVSRYRDLMAGGHLYDTIPESDELLLSHLDINNGAKLFIWDGHQVGGCTVPMGEENEPVFLIVTLDNDSKLSQGFSKSMTLTEVNICICDKLKVNTQDMVLKNLVQNDKGDCTVVLLSEEDMKKTLAALGMTNGDNLLLEKHGQTRSSSMEDDWKSQLPSNKVLVTVENRSEEGRQAPGGLDYAKMTIDVDGETSVSELKMLALSSFGIHEIEGGGRLRIDHEDLGLRPPIMEQQTVFEACINSKTTVVLQPGRPPTTVEITICVTTNSTRWPLLKDSGMDVIVSKIATVSECLDEVLIQAAVTEGSWYLRKTDWCGEPADILDDLDQRLEESPVNDGDHILLVEGRLSPKGFIRLPIWCYPTPESVKLSKNNSGILSQIVAGFNYFFGGSSGTVRSDEVTATRGNVKLGEIEIAKEATLNDLKLQLMTLELATDLPIPSPEFIRLRLVEDGRLTTVLRGEEKSLRYLKLTSNSVLAVQILPEEEDLSGNQLLLSVQQRIPDTREYQSHFDLVWDTNNGPTLSSLTQIVARALQVQSDDICMAKHLPSKFEWLVLEFSKMHGKQKGRKKVKDNLKQAPFNLRDGDDIGVKSKRCDPNNLDDFGTEHDELGKIQLVQEAEDKRQMRETKKQRKGYGDWSKSRRQEVGIRIDVGDFS